MGRPRKNIEVSDEVKDLLDNTNNEQEMEEQPIMETNDEFRSVVGEVASAVDFIDKLDTYFSSLEDRLKQVDEELMDLLHYIENYTLTPKQSVIMVKLLQDKRQLRRGIKKDIEIKTYYNANKNKIINSGYREMFMNDLFLKARGLNTTYNPRRISNEELEEILKGNKKVKEN